MPAYTQLAPIIPYRGYFRPPALSVPLLDWTTMATHPSARNAMKHGFCSHLFLAEENTEHITIIRDELYQCYKPKIDEELRLIAELAVAKFKVFENERLRHSRAVEEKEHAGLLFDKDALDEFHLFRDKWLQSPAEHIGFLTSSLLGTEFFIRLWTDFQDILQAPKSTLSFNQICQAVMMMGSHWNIQQINHQGRTLFGLYLALHPSPEPEINRWISLSGTTFHDSNLALAQEIYAMAPATEQALRELLELAKAQIEHLQWLKTWAVRNYETARTNFVAKSCGLGLNDPVRINESRLFHRYYTTDLNRADRLERRLEILKRSRALHRRNTPLDDSEQFLIHPEPGEIIVPQTQEFVVPIQDDLPVINQTLESVPKFEFNESQPLAWEAVAESSLISPEPGESETVQEMQSIVMASNREEMIDSLSRMPIFFSVDWSNRSKVTKFEQETIDYLIGLPAGPDRDKGVMAYFGTEGKLQRAYRKWAKVSA